MITPNRERFYIDTIYNYQLIWNMKSQDSESGAIYTLPNQDKKTKSRRELKKMKEQESDLKFYNWDYKENYTYITYLQNFRAIFNTQQDRKRAKVFNHISKLIITRNPHQIKSHHQKMMIRHQNNIEAIIDYLRMKIIKHIKANPQCLRQIEIINQNCQTFFQQETGFKQRVAKKKNQEDEALLIGNQQERVKIEESLNEPNYTQLKFASAEQKQVESGEVKIQDYEQIKIIKH